MDANKLQKYCFFSLHGAFCRKISAKSTQRYSFQDLVERSRRLKEALEIHQFLHVGMEIGLLLYAFVDLHKKLFVN